MDASRVLESLEQHILLDGFRIVIDLEKSRGSYLYHLLAVKVVCSHHTLDEALGLPSCVLEPRRPKLLQHREFSRR